MCVKCTISYELIPLSLRKAIDFIPYRSIPKVNILPLKYIKNYFTNKF